MTTAKIRLPLLVLVVATAALAGVATLWLFSTYMLYDDEGYVLLSLRNFAEHGHLYGDVYSQYGPLPFALYYLLHLCGMPLTHVAGRTLVVLAWSGSATLAAWAVWRVTRSTAIMLAVLVAVYVYLWIMVSEPSHPGGMIAFITAVMAALGCRLLVAGRWSAWAALAGAGCAALLLTKINIGVFAGMSIVTFLLLHSANDRIRRLAPWGLAAGLALFPFLLMRTLLGTPWVTTFAVIFALSATASVLSAGRGADARATGRQWLWAVAGALPVVLIVWGIILARGTTLSELGEGMVLGPLRHPGHFSLTYDWASGAYLAALVSFFIFGLAWLRMRRAGPGAADSLVAALRLFAVAGLVLALLRFPSLSPDKLVFGFALSGLWLFLWPLQGEDPNVTLAQRWLGLVFLGQCLHAYPVTGSQIAWGTFLALPLAAIGGWSTTRWLVQRPRPAVRRLRAGTLLLQAALLVFAGALSYRMAEIARRYFESRALQLPGAEPLRLPDGATALYRLLTFNAEAHCDMLFSLPGMFSLNLWTDLPTPTLVNVTHWFSLLDDRQQAEIVRALGAHPRSAVIVQEDHLAFLRKHDLTPGGPLFDYVMREYETAFEIDGFQFRVHRGRQIAPLQTAELFFRDVPATAPKAEVANSMVKLCLLLPPDQQVARVDLVQMEDPRWPPLILTGKNVRIEVTPINLEGQPVQETQTRTFPFALRGPALVAFYFDRAGLPLSSARTLIVVRNAAGAELALVRLRR